MIGPRGMKVFRDVLGRPGRSLLAMVAMAAGIFEIGAMLYKYVLLQPELDGMYGRTTPSSATLITDDASDAVVDLVRSVPGVGAVEARPVVMARARIGGDEWIPAVLYVVRDFDRLQLDTFKPEQGAWPPKPGEVLLERSALQVAKAGIGDPLAIRLPGGDDLAVPISGTVHAAGLAPAWMEHMVPGFVSWDSPLRGSDHGESAQIRFAVADHPFDEGHIREVADSVRATLERAGHEVSRVTVPPPGRHPHADQMEAFLFLLLAFGILSFALSTLLVAGMIHEWMAEQVKQIGVMKAIGGTDRQIAAMYLGQVSLLAAGALAIGIPVGLAIGGAYARFAAGILNADLSQRPFPWWLVAAEIAAGLLVPVLVAMVPIRRAARISVREALGDEPGAQLPSAGRRPLTLPFLSRPLALSLRATFQRRGRLALTVGTLAVGGAAFMSALNVASAWTRGVERDFAGRRYDLTAGFAEAQPIETVARILATVPDVEKAEYWPGAQPFLIGKDGVPGGTVALVGVTPGSTLMGLPILGGRWLGAADSNGAVVNRALLLRNPSLAIGREVRVRMAGGHTAAYPIVGIVKEMAPMPVIYAPAPAVLAATGRPADLTRSARIVTRRHDDAGQKAAAAAVESAFAGAGIEISGMQRMQDTKQGILDHLVIIFSVLTIAATIVVFVGGLALASNLMLSVIQRTREIGVLGAIGARPRTIAFHVWAESLAIGLLGWLAGLALAVPLSWALETATGNIFFKTPLDFHLSPMAALLWLGVVAGLATFASVAPATRAARLPVREALAHA